jgi:hypothetical protein
MGAGQPPFHRLAQIGQQMPPVSNLDRVWRTDRDAAGVFG